MEVKIRIHIVVAIDTVALHRIELPQIAAAPFSYLKGCSSSA
jgi:hypothetical protein